MRRRVDRSALPPGPRGGLIHTLRYLRSPFDFYRDLTVRYGDTFLVHVAGTHMVGTSSPEAIRAIFTASPETFEPQSSDTQIPLIGPSSLFNRGGDEHRRLRRLVSPPFQGNRMRAHGAMMRETALAWARGVRPGAPFSFKAAAEDMMVAVILRVMFGDRDERLVAELSSSLLGLLHGATSPAVAYFPVLRRRWLGLGPWARLQDAVARLDRKILRDLAERRRTGHQGDDVISLLLAARDESGAAMSDQEIRDQFYTFALAGNETSAMTLSWAMYWAHRHPAMLARLRAELDEAGRDADPDRIARLPYLDLFVKETLRLYPNVIDVPRRLALPLDLPGYRVPAGLEVTVPIVAVHAREDLYPDPARFDPERFARRSFTPFEYLPFGGGHRRCVGGPMAEYQIKVMLGALLAAFDFECLETRLLRPALRTVTSGPEGDLRFKIIGPRREITAD